MRSGGDIIKIPSSLGFFTLNDFVFVAVCPGGVYRPSESSGQREDWGLEDQDWGKTWKEVSEKRDPYLNPHLVSMNC